MNESNLETNQLDSSVPVVPVIISEAAIQPVAAPLSFSYTVSTEQGPGAYVVQAPNWFHAKEEVQENLEVVLGTEVENVTTETSEVVFQAAEETSLQNGLDEVVEESEGLPSEKQTKSIGYTDEQLETLHSLLIDFLEKANLELTHDNVVNSAMEILVSGKLDLASENFGAITERLIARVLGFGPLTELLSDGSVTEVMVNGPKNIYVERSGKLTREDVVFSSESELLQVINRIVSQVGRRIDTASPLVDARLPDGSRVNAIVPPLALTGPTLTIRRFPANPLSMDRLVEIEALTSSMAEFLKACVKAKLNLVISGGTGSGKTTLLNALASCIPSAERVITIEDAAEMKIGLPHLVGLESRQSNVEGKGEVPIRQLVKNSLRMRPDRIVVGEIRGGEALDMLQAMNTGHQGSLTTVHANAPLEALYRIETMTLMSDVELPLSAIRAQIKQAVSVVVQQERLSSGRRVVTGVSMLLPNFADRESGYELISIFEFVKTSGMHRATGQLPPQPELFADAGVELLEDWFLI